MIPLPILNPFTFWITNITFDIKEKDFQIESLLSNIVIAPGFFTKLFFLIIYL